MLVYGDLKFEQDLSSALRKLRSVAATTSPADLDALRGLLIQCGQLEQGIEDYCSARPGSGRGLRNQIVQATDTAAAAFYRLWAQAAATGPLGPQTPKDCLNQLSSNLWTLDSAENPTLEIKVPEGFAIYGVFPEQYCVSIARWAAEHSQMRDSLVLAVIDLLRQAWRSPVG